MTNAVSYIVVPFVLARKGKLAPGIPQTFNERNLAKRAGAALGATKAGAIVLEQKAGGEKDVYEEPRMIWHFGDIPKELFEFA